MSKNKKTTDDSQQTAEEPTVETPQAETPAAKSKAASPASKVGSEKNLACPACQHTTVIIIGEPYKRGDQQLQYVQCKKCSHLFVDVL